MEEAGRKEQRRKWAERDITSGGFILAQVTHSLFHIYFLAMLGKGKIDTLISPAHFPGPSGAEAEMTYHCEQGEDVTVFTNSCGRKIIILKVCGLYRPYLLSQTTRKLISDTNGLISNNQSVKLEISNPSHKRRARFYLYHSHNTGTTSPKPIHYLLGLLHQVRMRNYRQVYATDY